MTWDAARVWLVVLGALFFLLTLGGWIPGIVQAFHVLGVHLEGGEDLVHALLGLAALAPALLMTNARRLGVYAIWLGVLLIAGSLVLLALVPRAGPWHLGPADTLVRGALGVASIWTGYVAARHAGASGREPRRRRRAAL